MQITDTVKLKKSALIAPAIAIISFILSPEFYNQLPDKYAHYLYLLAMIVATFVPQLLKTTPPQSERDNARAD